MTPSAPHATVAREDGDEVPESTGDLRLRDIPLRQTVELVRIDLPDHEAEPLLERGLLPGCRLCPIRLSPFGDPVVAVDGSLFALRRETAGCICVQRLGLATG